MNKKILIGSVIAVVILVVVSFTGVVGYQTTKSSTIARASPLFSVRSKRALDEESEDLTCDFVGKGEESVLSIPKREDRTALDQKFIDIISKIDDETFNRFTGIVINLIRMYDTTKDEAINKIEYALYQLRKNPDILKNNFIDVESRFNNSLTIYMGCTIYWVPGCNTLNVWCLVFYFPYVILFTLAWILIYHELPTTSCSTSGHNCP